MDESPAGEPDWRRAVRVREDPTVAAELEERGVRDVPRPSVGVTDLLAPRLAFWRRTGPPVPVPPERRVRLEEGRFLHREVGPLIAPSGALEVRVRRDGVVGRIDALTDLPVEVKSTGFSVDASALTESRPDHVEQLGIYCALLQRPAGRLVTIVMQAGSVQEVRTHDLTFRELPELFAEVRERAHVLRTALERGSAGGLPRCRWFDRGCEYRTVTGCDCTGLEPDPPSGILERVERVEPRPDLDRDLLPRLRGAMRSAHAPSIPRFRDLIYPRRAYFERTLPEPPPPAASPRARESGADQYRQLLEAVESGPLGEVTRLPSLSEEPEEEVGAFRGDPFLLRTSRARPPRAPEELVSQAPQYALELGFRCAATGRRSGRLMASFDRPGEKGSRLRVFEFEFSPISAFSRVWRARERTFRAALRDHDPRALPACPGWMFPDCPYRAECACGTEPGRSQR